MKFWDILILKSHLPLIRDSKLTGALYFYLLNPAILPVESLIGIP